MDHVLATDPEDLLTPPIRTRLFSLLAELNHPAGAGEPAKRLGLDTNGVPVRLENQSVMRIADLDPARSR